MQSYLRYYYILILLIYTNHNDSLDIKDKYNREYSLSSTLNHCNLDPTRTHTPCNSIPLHKNLNFITTQPNGNFLSTEINENSIPKHTSTQTHLRLVTSPNKLPNWSYEISNQTSKLGATTRSGIPIPPDVASFGRAIIYHTPNNSLTMEVWLPGLESDNICCSFRQVGAAYLPPMLVILAPKNHIVKMWEKRNFKTNKRKNLIKEMDLVQRAYRLVRPSDLMNTTAKYSGEILQITVPPQTQTDQDFTFPISIPITDDSELTSVGLDVDEIAETSWIFNWEKFPELYNLSHDYTKSELPKFASMNNTLN